MPNIVRDLPDTSSYWAAVWTMCMLPDVHVICDAPIGCFNLVGTAIPDYTDAIPHIENLTPSVITEEEVGGTGTGPAVQKTYEGLLDEGVLDGKHLIVVSTAESEMIGSDLSDLVTKLHPGTTFFHSESLSDDEWHGRDRVLQWLWDTYGAKQAAGIDVEPGTVNIIGPTYGCFNSPSDLHEIKRLIEGAGGRVNMVFPAESTLDDLPKLAKGQVNVVLYREFGHTLADLLGQPWLHAPFGIQATTAFLRDLGELLGTAAQAEAFIKHEKKTTLWPVWDIWRGPQGDWFGTASVGVVAPGTYADGLKTYLGDELGMPVAFAVARPRRADDPDPETIRKTLHTKPPMFVYGSINERIYLAEGGVKGTNFIPVAFPGAVVRRALGTPYMGYSGAVTIIQEIVNYLYDALFHFLPLDTAYQKNPNGTPAATGPNPGNLPWQPDAKRLLDERIQALPVIAQISASRELQMKVEAQARAAGLSEVTPELAAAVLTQPQT